MSITERLANLSIPTVIITIVVLLILRWLLLKQKKYAIAKSIAEFAESLAVAMGLVFLVIRPFFVQAFFIPSASMEPTLMIHDHILVNKLVYRFREPKLGDVIVFKAPIEATPDVKEQVIAEADERGLEGAEREEFIKRECKRREKDFIKRVIGVPGDLVRVTPGYVIVGQTQYGHRYLESVLHGFATPNGPGKVKLSNGKVLVDGRLVSNSEIAAAVGEPNARVKVVPGKVYINGKAINEPYTAEDPDMEYPLLSGPRMTNPKWIVTKNGVHYVKIPKGKLLVMGDNRNDSNDARFWGLLDRKRVLGKAMFVFWPVTRIRWVR
ncbi:MAG: signal peptidase I [Armatimonadetes bacterium]|nr:signal peptidase I [Armatimonadota bacterium]